MTQTNGVEQALDRLALCGRRTIKQGREDPLLAIARQLQIFPGREVQVNPGGLKLTTNDEASNLVFRKVAEVLALESRFSSRRANLPGNLV